MKKTASMVLEREAKHFKQLAWEASLKVLLVPDDWKAKYTRAAREHLLRAETYQAAATLVKKL